MMCGKNVPCDSVQGGNCTTVITGQCYCQQGQQTKNSTYDGRNCECCKSGECQKHCFNRFTTGRDKSDMCSGSGSCNCEERRNGEECNVIIVG